MTPTLTEHFEEYRRLSSLTHFNPLALAVRLVPWSLANLCPSGHAAGDLALGHPQVQKECGDLAVEVHAALVPQHSHQMQLKALAHAAYLRLGKRWGQVS